MTAQWLAGFATPRWRLLAAAGAAALYVGACGFGLTPLGWVCLVPLVWALDDAKASLARAFVLGWFFGFIAQCAFDATAFGTPISRGALGTLLLWSASRGVVVGGWALLVAWLVHVRRAPLAFVVPVSWVLLEWTWPGAFSASLASSLWRQTWLIQSADAFGALGLSFTLALSSAVLYEWLAAFLRRRAVVPGMPAVVLVVLVGVHCVYGWTAVRDVDDDVAHADRYIRVGLVQINALAAAHGGVESLQRYREQSQEVVRQGAELLVWPVVHSLDEVQAAPPARPLLTSAPGEATLSVRAYVIDSSGKLEGALDEGGGGQLYAAGAREGVVVGGEIAQPGIVRARMGRDPQVLVSLDAARAPHSRFGAERALAQATLRALEHRRFVVHAASFGVSAIVDPAGRTVGMTPRGARANLVRDIALLEGATLYAQLGDWPAYLCLMAALAWSRRALQAALVALWRWRKEPPCREAARQS